MNLKKMIFKKRPVFTGKICGIIYKKNAALMLVSMLIIFVYSIEVSAINGENILNKVSFLEIGEEDSYVMELEMLSHKGDKNEKAVMKVYLNRVGGSEKSIASFVQPENLSSDLYLSVDNNTWMYKKGLKRPIRISPGQKLFGDAGLAETIGINYSAKYNVMKTEKENAYYYLELKAEDSSTAYQNAKLRVEGESYNLSRVVLTAVNGQHLKELSYSNYRTVNGFKVSDILVKNLLYENNHSTELRVKKIYKYNLPVEAFQPLMLNKFELFRRDSE